MVMCPICKDKSFTVWKEGLYRVNRCENCGVAFLNPLPENPVRIYNEDYFRKWYIKYYAERSGYTGKLFSLVEKQAEARGKLLDVGCGAGILMEAVREKGWEACGQDVSPFAVEYCTNKGFKVYANPLPETDIPENSFDIITMFDVLAHLRDPLSYLLACRRLLKPGGCLAVKTPSHTPLLFNVARLFSFTGKSRVLLHVPAQIFHFDRKALACVNKAAGLKLLRIFEVPDFSFSADKGCFAGILECSGFGRSLVACYGKVI